MRNLWRYVVARAAILRRVLRDKATAVATAILDAQQVIGPVDDSDTGAVEP